MAVKDLKLEAGVQWLLDLCMGGEPDDIARVLHSDFVAVGVEHGLYLNADAKTYLGFLKREARDRAKRVWVEWIDIRDRIAAGCMVEEQADTRKTILLTMLCGEDGWRIISATFGVETRSFVKAERPGMLQ